MLHCPRCYTSLAQINGKIGTVYDCAKCQGAAIGLPVLRRALVPSAITEIWSKTFSEESRVNLKCPSCRRLMVEVTLEGTSTQPLELDVCRGCHFLWFDPNELEQIPEKPPHEPTLDERMPPEVKEMLALKQIERIRDDEFAKGPIESWQYLPASLGLPIEQGGKLNYTRPWITWLLAAICVLVAIVNYAWVDADLLISRFGLIPNDLLRMGGVTFITSFFLHGGIWHLIGNMYFLVAFGDNVEAALGRIRYLLLLLAAAVGGGLLHSVFDSRSAAPLIGASGGISGVILFYALMFPKARLGILASFYHIYKWFAIPAWFALIGWIGLQIYGVLTQLAGFSNVSALAHLGGAMVGLAFWGWTRLRLARFDRRAKHRALD